MKLKFDHNKNDLYEALGLTSEEVDEVMHFIIDAHNLKIKRSEMIEKLVDRFSGAQLIVAIGSIASISTLFYTSVLAALTMALSITSGMSPLSQNGTQQANKEKGGYDA